MAGKCCGLLLNFTSRRSRMLCMNAGAKKYSFPKYHATRQLSSSIPLRSEDFPTLENIEESPSKIASGGGIFSSTRPVLWTVKLLCSIKDCGEMTWIQVIVGTTLAIRGFLALPLSIVQQRSLARLENLKPELESLSKELGREVATAKKMYNWDDKHSFRMFKRSYKKHWRSLMETHNCHPVRSVVLALFQLPVWVCFSSAIRNIVFKFPYPITSEQTARWLEMKFESLPWIDSLVSPDPIVFPLIFMVANLTNIQLHQVFKTRGTIPIPKSKLQMILPWIFRISIIGVSIFAMFVPSAVSLYWATSGVTALLLNIVLKLPGPRRFFKIPSTPSNPS